MKLLKIIITVVQLNEETGEYQERTDEEGTKNCAILV